MTRRLNAIILAALLLIGVPYYWFLVDNRPGDAAPKPVTIAQLRQLAASLPGAAPSSVEMELVGWRFLPGNLLAAGTGLQQHRMGILAFMLPVPGDRPILIDTGITKADAEEMGLDPWQSEAQARVESAMDRAGLILVTHEHPDHEGALVAHGGTALMQAAALRPAQLRPAPLAAELGWKNAASPAPRLTGNLPQAIAPGVVVIPAPSHTPGSQLIYVRLGDGREFLFAGDISTMAQSWEELRARSRLVSTLFAPEDRPEVYSWLKTIRTLKAQAPALVIVPGHDPDAVLRTDHPTGIRSGFDLSQINASGPKVP